ncbi:unnamed protein product [marine sediment metagenome]|uniref:Uncharacterized protein n=1 Tax=marine sediment metagenome TaxID=412755 RepID=X1C434_9ZZZZ
MLLAASLNEKKYKTLSLWSIFLTVENRWASSDESAMLGKQNINGFFVDFWILIIFLKT